ncbi:hypothetical protein KB713_004224 [Salmonella enterica]|nr:hypothetical protein [Salmonella enterica]
MNLNQLKEISLLSAPTEEEQRAIIQRLNQTRFDFGVKELPEIMPPAPCGWISRRTPPVPSKKADENRWKYYLEKIHEWIAVLEAREKLLGPAEKIKRFWEKSKLGSICMVFIALIAFANDIFDFFCNIQTYL